MKVFVIGAESSGTNWAQSIFDAHPDVEEATHRSFPYGALDMAHWPDLSELDPEMSRPVVICTRDRNVVTNSQYARGMHQANPEFFDVDRAVEEISRQVAGWKGPVFYFNYEAALTYGKGYVGDLMTRMGLDFTRMDWSGIEFRDGNAKYMLEARQKPKKIGPREWPIHDDPKVVMMLTAPRLCFTNFMTSLVLSVYKTGWEFVQAGGTTGWDQGFTKGVETALGMGADYILCLDYDSVFSPDDCFALFKIMQEQPECGAVFATQACRHYNNIMCPELDALYEGELTWKRRGHFGLTMIRKEVFDHLEKPWFWNVPNEDGEWKEGKIDADITFWEEMRACGINVAQANDVIIGHEESFIMWPDQDRIIHQPVRDYLATGTPKLRRWVGPFVEQAKKFAQKIRG